MTRFHGAAAATALAVLSITGGGAKRASADALPATIVWAWERPEDLRGIDPASVGVAFLARTLTLDGERVLAQPRLQPLDVPADARLIAVVRIETGRHLPALTETQRAETVRQLLRAVQPRARALQIDFDATVSERTFYRQLLFDVRKVLPPQVALSITALASWCFDDRWLEGLPIDEAVPMLFRMGPDRDIVRRRLEAGSDFTERACRQSVGLSTDESWPRLPHGRRRYVFHPRSWSPAAVREILTKF